MSEPDSTRAEGTRLLPPPAPTGATASSPRRLYRDPHSWLGGVASGLAAYFEIDPVIVRLLWIVALLTGIGFPAYLVCWAVIPKAKTWPPPGYAERTLSDSRAGTVTSGLVIVALAVLIGKGVSGLGDLVLPAALIGFGVYLLNQRSQQRPAPRTPGAAAPFVDGDAAPEPAGAASGPAEAAAPGLVTPTVLSLLAIGAGVCWGLQAAGLAQFTLAGMAAGGLLIVGAGLFASLWFGRAPGLILTGIGLAVVMVVSAAAQPWIEKAHHLGDQALPAFEHVPGLMGDRVFQPSTLAELEPSYELGLGKLTLDLSHLDFAGEARDVRVNLGLGDLIVILPPGPSVTAHGQVALGEATVLEQHREGSAIELRESDPGRANGSLNLDFQVGLGKGVVRREL